MDMLWCLLLTLFLYPLNTFAQQQNRNRYYCSRV